MMSSPEFSRLHPVSAINIVIRSFDYPAMMAEFFFYVLWFPLAGCSSCSALVYRVVSCIVYRAVCVSVCVCVCVYINRSGLNQPRNIRYGCQSGTYSAGQENIRGTSTKLQREHENKNENKNDKKRNNNVKHMPEKDRRRALDRESLVHRHPRVIRYPLVSVFSIGTIDAAWGVLGSVQSTRL